MSSSSFHNNHSVPVISTEEPQTCEGRAQNCGIPAQPSLFSLFDAPMHLLHHLSRLYDLAGLGAKDGAVYVSVAFGPEFAIFSLRDRIH